MTKALGREDFLAAAKGRKRTSVEVPELGGTLWLQELSTAQLLEYNMLVLEYEGKRIPPTALARITARLVAFSACDADGNLLFTEADVDTLAKVDISVLMSLRQSIVELSGFNRTVDEVAADLKKAQTGSSATD